MREISKEKFDRLAGAAIRFLGGAVLCGGDILGGYAPFVLGWVAAAGNGAPGLLALLGCGAGAAVFLPFSTALRTVAVAVLLFSANNAFASAKFCRRPLFLPLLTAAMFFAVEFVYLTRSGAAQAAYCVLSAVLAAVSASCCAAVLQKRKDESIAPVALFGVILGFLAAAASVQTANGFMPARVLALVLVLLLAFERPTGEASAAALCIGLTMDLCAGESSFLYAVVYAFCALAAGVERKKRRVPATLLFCAAAAAFSLPLDAKRGLMLIYETLGAALVFLLLPGRLFRGKREAKEQRRDESEERSAVKRLLSETAAALREIYESVSRVPPQPDENPAVIFDRAAERVCRSCSLKHNCWQENYSKTYNALNDATAALLAHGVGKGEYFPPYFANRCIRFPSFLSAVSVELNAFLLRKNYRMRLSGTRSQAAKQYAELSELLDASAEGISAAKEAFAAAIPYRIGYALRAREGQKTSGDSMAFFETQNARLCLLLSDGMGSGEEAHRESAMAVRLLERFLKAGIHPKSALKTLSSALSLRSEETESFTTVDLLLFSLADGAAELYKLGAAPSYVKRGGKVKRVTCSCLPAGLDGGEGGPEATRLRLEKGSFLVMLTDGVADALDDKWLVELLSSWEEEDAQMLVSAILAESEKRRGRTDDGCVIALYLPENEAKKV